jgi:hypothetical protein
LLREGWRRHEHAAEREGAGDLGEFSSDDHG